MSAPTASRANLLIPGVIALALIVVLAIAIPTDTSASHDFNDVPNNMLFHEEVSRIRDAGITTGCGGGNYCPWDPVSRLAMAAFMNRGFGRVAMSKTQLASTVLDVTGDVKVGEVTIDVPGAGASATQFVEVHGQINFADFVAGAPCVNVCVVRAYLKDPATGAQSFGRAGALPISFYNTLSVSEVFKASPTGPHTYEMWVSTFGAATEITLGGLTLTATTYPFGASGGNVFSSASAGESTALDAGGLDAGGFGFEMDGSNLKGVLEGLRTERP